MISFHKQSLPLCALMRCTTPMGDTSHRASSICIRIISRPWRHRAPAASWIWSWLYMNSKRNAVPMASPPCFTPSVSGRELELPPCDVPSSSGSWPDIIEKSHTQLHLIHHRFHMRFEIDNQKQFPLMLDYLRQKRVHLISFMDHTPGQGAVPQH